MSVHFIPAFADNYIYVLESSAGVWIVDPGDAEPFFNGLRPDRWCQLPYSVRTIMPIIRGV
jgi:hypothetical protein